MTSQAACDCDLWALSRELTHHALTIAYCHGAARAGIDEDCGDAGAEALRRASVLRPLVQAYLSRTGSLESGIGTMMGAVHLLPGTTQSSVAAKGGYDAEAMAAMTLREFDRWFALEICRYNNSIHSSLGCTPVAKWEALAGEMAGDIPFDMEAFRVSFLPSEQRQVRRDGIHLFDLRYWSDALASYVGRRDGKVVVRYDPRDLSAVWVELDGGRCVEARYRNLEIPPVSLWEYR